MPAGWMPDEHTRLGATRAGRRKLRGIPDADRDSLIRTANDTTHGKEC